MKVQTLETIPIADEFCSGSPERLKVKDCLSYRNRWDVWEPEVGVTPPNFHLDDDFLGITTEDGRGWSPRLGRSGSQAWIIGANNQICVEWLPDPAKKFSDHAEKFAKTLKGDNYGKLAIATGALRHQIMGTYAAEYVAKINKEIKPLGKRKELMVAMAPSNNQAKKTVGRVGLLQGIIIPSGSKLSVKPDEDYPDHRNLYVPAQLVLKDKNGKIGTPPKGYRPVLIGASNQETCLFS